MSVWADFWYVIGQMATQPFLVRALLVGVMSGMVCGVVGSFVVLRGMSFVGDAVAHSVFPGIAVAFVVGGNMILGGFVAGAITALLVALFAQNRRLQEDSVIGVFFAGAFALGVVVISASPKYGGSMDSFLVGSILGISNRDVVTVAVAGALVLAVLAVVRHQLIAVSLDREAAEANGLPVFWLDMLLYILVTVAIVISIQAVGNILVLALLVTPAATARLLTDQLSRMVVLAPLAAALSTVVGLYISRYYGWAAGGSIVLVATALFTLAYVAAPRHGMLARRSAARKVRAGPATSG